MMYSVSQDLCTVLWLVDVYHMTQTSYPFTYNTSNTYYTAVISLSYPIIPLLTVCLTITGTVWYDVFTSKPSTCADDCVVNLAICRHCPNKEFYLGQTTNTFRKRMNGHRDKFNNEKCKIQAFHILPLIPTQSFNLLT